MEANIFRILPPPLNSRRRRSKSEEEEEESIFDDACHIVHVHIVYEFFLQFMDRPSFDPSAAETWLNPRFLQKLLILFDQEDPLEREYLKSIVHKIYAKFVSLRGFIRKSIMNIFLTFIYETDRHNGISELLEICASIIDGFALPLKEEHKVFLQKTLIPLHKMEGFYNYHLQLTYCLAKFLAKDLHCTLLIFQNILRVWPVADSTKQILLLEEIEELLYYADVKELRLIAQSLTFRVSSCIESLNFQVIFVKEKDKQTRKPSRHLNHLQ